MRISTIFLLSFLVMTGGLASGQAWQKAPMSLVFMGKTYNKAAVTYGNGTVKYGYVAIPKTCHQKEISFKTEKDAHVTDIESTVLSMISVYNADSSVYVFERVNYVVKPGDPPKKNGWLFVMAKGYATLYFKIDQYKIDKNGVLNFIADEVLPMNFVRKKNQNTAVLVAYTNPYPGAGVMIGSNKPFEKYGPVIFAEDKELVSQIKSGKYTSLDIEEVVKIYNQYMAEK
jgi:hypothetical protein